MNFWPIYPSLEQWRARNEGDQVDEGPDEEERTSVARARTAQDPCQERDPRRVAQDPKRSAAD